MTAAAPWRGWTCVETVVIVGVLALSLVFFLLLPLLVHATTKAMGTRCSNNLRRIGLAAREYADTQRAFPHVGPLASLQGGVESTDGPRVYRALVWHGYLDDVDTLACPSSYDMPVMPGSNDPLREMKVPDPRRWSWAGGTGNPDVSPLGSDGVVEVALQDSTELSYGWTRRGLGPDAAATTPLAADRSCRVAETPGGAPGRAVDGGNHEDGVYVLVADGSVSWTYGDDDGAPLLTSTDGGGGALGILPVRADPDAVAMSRGAGIRTGVPLRRVLLAFGPTLLVLVAFEARRRRRASPEVA